MSPEEQAYSVLLVSASEKFNSAIKEYFSIPTFSPVLTAAGLSAAKRAAAQREFDIVIVNSPLSDGNGVDFAVDTAESSGTVVLFLARAEEYDDLCNLLVGHGVFMMQKPLSGSVLQVAGNWLISARERTRKTERKTVTIEQKMNEIRAVNRAKWLLITELKMSEPDAHRYIEKQAMDRCVPRKQVAEEIIRLYG